MFTTITNGFRNDIAYIRAYNEARLGIVIAYIRAHNEFVDRCVQVVQKAYHVANAVFSDVVGHKVIRGFIRIYDVLNWKNRPINPLPPNLPIPPQVVFRPVNVTPEKPT